MHCVRLTSIAFSDSGPFADVSFAATHNPLQAAATATSSRAGIGAAAAATDAPAGVAASPNSARSTYGSSTSATILVLLVGALHALLR